MTVSSGVVDWASLAVPVVSVPRGQLGLFLQTAPAGTLIECDDEVYRRLTSGEWRHLDELVYDGGSFYSDYRVHESSSPEALHGLLGFEHLMVRVLKLGVI